MGAPLPSVVFIDPDLGVEGTALEDDEHPPTDIQRGQEHVSDVVNAIRSGPYWKDSIILITYDEHGGFYDHARPPRALQAARARRTASTPANARTSPTRPAACSPVAAPNARPTRSAPPTRHVLDAEALCPQLKADPTGPYPKQCAAFDQEGVRVPLIAVSPFSKQAYVSHTARDHTAIIALIEKRFFLARPPPHRSRRNAASLEELFDFTNAPSLHTSVGSAGGPGQDCTP